MRGNPYWMTVRYAGKDKNGKPFKRGDRVFYYPNTRTCLTGEEAEQAARAFEAARSDDDNNNGCM